MPPSLPLEFPQWLEAAKRGHGAGFDALFQWLGGPIHRFAIGRGAADAEAITNDAFLAAFRGIGTFEGDAGQFRSWVFSITRNRLIDAYRWDQRRPQVVDAPVPDRAERGAEETALAQLAGEGATTMLAGLTSEQRDVILLRVVAELSLAETAKIVEKPVTAVKRLQARGLQRLRAEFLRAEVS